MFEGGREIPYSCKVKNIFMKYNYIISCDFIRAMLPDVLKI